MGPRLSGPTTATRNSAPRLAARLVLIGVACGLAGCGLSQPIPPVAEAGSPLIVAQGQPLVLDGSGSFDPAGGTIVSYRWTIVQAPESQAEEVGRVVGTAGPEARTSARLGGEVASAEVWTLELEITDEEGLSASDVVTVTVVP
ncbi:MAG TPA: hypothetical protein VER55_05800 [Ardenticatenaceae bacterium]|nr:hypothetical protein [Ardenticatenaceae bacterium]